MRTRRTLAVLLLLGLSIGMTAQAQAGPLSWLWPFNKPAPAKKHGKIKPGKGHGKQSRPKTPPKRGWW